MKFWNKSTTDSKGLKPYVNCRWLIHLLFLKKRKFLLLEVLIALAIVALCALPLLYPHAAIIVEEKKLIAYMRMQLEVERLLGEKIVQLYQGKIHLNQLKEGYSESLDSEALEKAGYFATLKWHIDMEKEGTPHSYYLVEADLSAGPQSTSLSIPPLIQRQLIFFIEGPAI